MKTTATTTYDYNGDGSVAKQTVVREETPGGDFLRIDGLTDDQIQSLVAIRDAFRSSS